MNHNPSVSSMLMSRAVTGDLNFKGAEGLSARTIDVYRRDLKRWLNYEGTKTLAKLNRKG